jgi:glycosyltransferase involved in cell wall biosynthesis
MQEIIYITESSGNGGAEKYLLELASRASLGYKICVALPFNNSNLEFRSLLRDKGIPAIDVKQYRVVYPWNLLLALQFFLKRGNMIFHFSLPHTDSCRWLLLAAALMKRRYFITEHSVPPEPLRENLYFFFTHILFNPLKKFYYRRALKVISVSEGNRTALVEKYGMPAGQIITIHNGIDCSAYAVGQSEICNLRKELGIPREGTVLTSIGRIDALKGQKYLIQAFEKLSVEHPSLYLLFAGEGVLRRELEIYVNSRRLSSVVKFAGYRNDIPVILGLSDIYVLPSLKEGFNFTVIEAMASGKPVVATKVPGVSEAVVEGETGLLCNIKDAEDLADKIEILLNSRELCREMGSKGMELALKHFDISTMISKTFELYRRTA